MVPGSPSLKKGFRTFNLFDGSEILRETGIWCLSYMDPRIKKFNFVEDDSSDVVNEASCITIKPNFQFASIYLTSRATKQKGDNEGYEKSISHCRGKFYFIGRNAILHSGSCSRKLAAIPPDARMRVFYKTEKGRSDAIHIIEDVIDEMMSAVSAAKNFLKEYPACDKNPTFDHKVASHTVRVWEMEDGNISLINHYAPKYFGLEICERIFGELGLARMRYLRGQFVRWASSFARTDSHARINKFFNLAAQDIALWLKLRRK